MKTFVWKVFSHRLYDNFLIKFSKGENCHTLFLWVFSLTDLLYQCNKQRTKQTVCLFVCCTCFSLTASFVATTVCRLIVLLALRDVPTLLITISWTSLIIRFRFLFQFLSDQPILSPHSPDHHPGQASSSDSCFDLILRRVQLYLSNSTMAPNINKYWVPTLLITILVKPARLVVRFLFCFYFWFWNECKTVSVFVKLNQISTN